VTLGATKNRIPHWFTEACAVWEQPDRRNFEATNLLVNATKAGKLFPIKDLDWGFIRPKANADRSQAYAQAEWVMEYIIATTKDKYKTINIMIEAFRDGKSQTEVFKDILGTTEEQFDKDFLLYAKKQIVEWGFDASPPPDLAAAQKEAKDKPEDPTAIGHLAIAQYSNRDARNGEANARKALDKAPDNIDALKVMAHFSFTTKKTDDAIEFAKRLERVDHNSRMAPRILADCYVEKRAWPEALAALELLKIREPQDTYSYERLANVYSQLGQIKNALPNYIELHKKTMNNPIYAREIADIYRTLGQQEDALHWYQSEMEINPYDSGAYQAMVSIHINAGNFPQATVAAMAMVDLDPDSATAWTYLATAQYRYGMASNNKAQLTQAKESAQKAVKIDPNGKGRDVLHMINAALGEPSDSPSADEPQTQPAQPQPKTKPHVEELAPDHAIE
jgi:tetratricopeptide (TPR) repeat protein